MKKLYIWLLLITGSSFLYGVEEPVYTLATFLSCRKDVLEHSATLLGDFIGACVEAGAYVFDYDCKALKDQVSILATMKHGYASLNADFKKGRCIVGFFGDDKLYDHDRFLKKLGKFIGSSTMRKLSIKCGDHFSVK